MRYLVVSLCLFGLCEEAVNAAGKPVTGNKPGSKQKLKVNIASGNKCLTVLLPRSILTAETFALQARGMFPGCILVATQTSWQRRGVIKHHPVPGPAMKRPAQTSHYAMASSVV